MDSVHQEQPQRMPKEQHRETPPLQALEQKTMLDRLSVRMVKSSSPRTSSQAMVMTADSGQMDDGEQWTDMLSGDAGFGFPWQRTQLPWRRLCAGIHRILPRLLTSVGCTRRA